MRPNLLAIAWHSIYVLPIMASILLIFIRLIGLAIPVLILGAVLLLSRNAVMASRSATRTSQVRSAHLEMTLEHETGRIYGEILTGTFQGQVLSDLALDELLRFHAEVQTDEQTVKLFETFPDSTHPDWRDQMEHSSAGDETGPQFSRQMSQDDAYRLLGLEAGSSKVDIREAYHRLIKRVHPDRGGSAALTAQITEARNTLLDDQQSPD